MVVSKSVAMPMIVAVIVGMVVCMPRAVFVLMQAAGVAMIVVMVSMVMRMSMIVSRAQT